MKKTFIILAVLLLCAAALAGCRENASTPVEKSGGDPVVLSGKYVATNIDDKVAMFSFNTVGLELEEIYVEFREDGTLTLHILSEAEEGTYSGSGNTANVTLEEDDEGAKLTVEGDKVIMAGDHGGTITFEKE